MCPPRITSLARLRVDHFRRAADDLHRPVGLGKVDHPPGANLDINVHRRGGSRTYTGGLQTEFFVASIATFALSLSTSSPNLAPDRSAPTATAFAARSFAAEMHSGRESHLLRRDRSQPMRWAAASIVFARPVAINSIASRTGRGISRRFGSGAVVGTGAGAVSGLCMLMPLRLFYSCCKRARIE